MLVPGLEWIAKTVSGKISQPDLFTFMDPMHSYQASAYSHNNQEGFEP